MRLTGGKWFGRVTMNKEKPLVMSTESVQAILAGRKTQERISVGTNPEYIYRVVGEAGNDNNPLGLSYLFGIERPRYDIGDILWVKETWCEVPYKSNCEIINGTLVSFPQYAYKADSAVDYTGLWRSSHRMPRAAARIFLRVVSVRIERLQDISEADAIAEGVPQYEGEGVPAICCRACKGTGFAIMPVNGGASESDCPKCDTAVKRYHNLWDFHNAKRNHGAYAWEKNPWVWVYEFERSDGYGR
jgi:hypothetical protein